MRVALHQRKGGMRGGKGQVEEGRDTSMSSTGRKNEAAASTPPPTVHARHLTLKFQTLAWDACPLVQTQ